MYKLTRLHAFFQLTSRKLSVRGDNSDLEDSNNISIGIHFFKVLVQIHYSRFPGGPEGNGT